MKKKFTALLVIVSLLSSLTVSCSTEDAIENEPINTRTETTTPENTQTSTTATENTQTEMIEEATTFIFTDSLGREVEVPKDITRVALSGPLTQIVLFALCPDKLVGLATAWDSSAEQYLDTEYYNLPIIGQLYGGKGTLNLETIAAAGAEVIIDVGEQKGNMTDDMDSLQEQLNIPTVHIDGYTDSMGDAYRKLGELLGMEEEAEVLADYCDELYANTLDIMNNVGESGKIRLLYCSGDAGINVIAKGSYHAELIDLLADNLAVVDNPSSRGTGNEVDLEQIMIWDPDVIIFAPDSIYYNVGSDPDWANVTAIRNGTYYEVPYNWMGFPPSVQRYLGLIWMTELLYPGAAQYNMYEETLDYFQLFYHSSLTRAQYKQLVANSIGVQQ